MILEAILGLLSLIGLLVAYRYVSFYRLSYWADLGVKVPSCPSRFPMGNAPNSCAPVMFRLKNATDVALEQYEETKGLPYYGTYSMNGKPVLVVRDPELVRQMLVKDFSSFIDRNPKQGMMTMLGKSGHLGDELWLRNIITISGDEWKDVRSTFTPVFTSGKIKGMSSLIQEVTVRLVNSLEQNVSGDEIDARTVFGKFSMDTIASCAFGIDAQSFTDTESPFVAHAKNLFRGGIKDGLRIALAIMPGSTPILRALKTGVFKPDETTFLYNVVKTAVEERMRTKQRRNDIIDLMVDAMKDELDHEEVDMEKEEQQYKDAHLEHKASKSKELDMITLGSTALILLAAGYDTTGQTMAYFSYILATHPEIQDKLQAEVDNAYEENTGCKALPYDVVQGLEYLDMVLQETLRRYIPVGVLTRVCTQDYVVPGHPHLKLKPGDELVVNSAGLHMDPNIFPDPEMVIPERFSKDGKASRSPYAFLSFGQGPRNCMGMRFALYEAKMALAATVHNYRFIKTAKTPKTIEFDPAASLSASKHPLWVKVKRRSS